ncbi:integrase, catalytic region, zinc finger, CCHC-type containing protein [Tanacetum coccineum]
MNGNHIVTEPVQRKAPGNVGNTGARGKKVICYNCRGEGHVARQCKEPKRKMDSQYFKDKALLMEAKEKGDVLDAENSGDCLQVEHLGLDAETEIDDNTIPILHSEIAFVEGSLRILHCDREHNKVLELEAEISKQKQLLSVLNADLERMGNPIKESGNLRKPVANSKPQWKPTGRHFSLFEKYPLTRIMEPTDMPIELPPKQVPKGSLVVQIVLWYLDSGCSRHMTGDRARLINFVEKFIGTVRFGNDEYAAIIGYGDYKLGDTIISRVYYVEGLKHNLFSVGQFCDGGLEVAFRQHSCHIRNYDMVDLLNGSRTTNLYSISLNDMMSASPVCLLTKASSTKSWLWHRRLNHLNFGIDELAGKILSEDYPC